MVAFCTSTMVRRIPRASTVVITPRRDSYGSLETSKLAEFASDLELAAQLRLSEATIVFDLTVVAAYGTGFLRILLGRAVQFQQRGFQVVCCGDKTGLLELIGADRWLTVTPDLCAALNVAADTASLRQQRPIFSNVS